MAIGNIFTLQWAFPTDCCSPGANNIGSINMQWVMLYRDRRDRMVFGFTTTYTIGAISTKDVSSNPAHDKMYSIKTICDKVCQWSATGRWLSPGTPISSTNKTDWNIFESGVKHHKAKPKPNLVIHSPSTRCSITLHHKVEWWDIWSAHTTSQLPFQRIAPHRVETKFYFYSPWFAPGVILYTFLSHWVLYRCHIRLRSSLVIYWIH
jgi:hypothetical protein